MIRLTGSHVAVWLVSGFAAVAAFASCNELAPLDENACGNRALEPGAFEDCDTFALGGAPPGPPTHCNAPGQPNECRMACEDDKYQCPDGWGCGQDGVCRQASMALADPVSLDEPPGAWFQLADVNGSGRDDLIVASQTSITAHFSDSDGRFASSFRMPITPNGPPTVGQLDNNATQDIAVPTSDGIAVLRGSSDAALLPTTYSSFEFDAPEPQLIAIDTIAPIPLADVTEKTNSLYLGDEPLILTGTKVSLLTTSGPTPVVVNGPPELQHSDDLVGYAVANFTLNEDEAGFDPEELALAYFGSEGVLVYEATTHSPGDVFKTISLRGSGADLLGDEAGFVRLPDGDHIEIGFAAVNVNPLDTNLPRGGGGGPCCQDKIPDLIVGGADHVYVSFGVGDGRFHSIEDELDEVREPNGLPADMTFSVAEKLEDCRPFPLAFEDLDGDGLPDVVMPPIATADGGDAELNGGIYLSTKTMLNDDYCIGPPDIPPPSADGWSKAEVADFNGDGNNDLIATPKGKPGLDVFLGTGNAKLNHTLIETEHPIKKLAMGDFDGDLLQDIAYAERAEAERDALRILYGRPFGVFGAPVDVGTLQSVSSLTALDIERTGLGWIDGITDLLVATETDNTSSFALLYGRSDRQLQAPYVITYPLLDANQAVHYTPLAVGYGAFGLADVDHPRMLLALSQLTLANQSGPASTLTGIEVSGDATLRQQGDANQLPASTGGITALIGKFRPTHGATERPLLAIGAGANNIHLSSPRYVEEPGTPTTGHWIPGAADVDELVLTLTDRSLVGGADNDAVGEFLKNPVEAEAAHQRRLAMAHMSYHNGLVTCDGGFVPSSSNSPGDTAPVSAETSVENASSVTALLTMLWDGPTPVGTELLLLTASDVNQLVKGGADGIKPTRFAPPTSQDGVEVMFLGFTCMNFDDDSADELVVMTLEDLPSATGNVEQRHAFIYGFDLTDLTNPVGVPIQLDGGTLPILADLGNELPVAGIDSGDVDGDGVEDLVVAARDGYFLLRGVARNP